MPELVKKLAVPPEKRANDDCELIAGALHVFISSIAEFGEGLCILCQIDTALPNSLSLCRYCSYSSMKHLCRIYDIGCPSGGQTR